jgi:hypothetical protein
VTSVDTDLETQAEALFASSLRPTDHPPTSQVRAAIEASLRTLGKAGCVGVMAEEFGDHPETAVPRMRWALDVVRSIQPALTPAADVG